LTIFASTTLVREIITQQKKGKSCGIYSICSANLTVLQACLLAYQKRNIPLLIESTCNQVNQDGGYTGMVPTEFVSCITNLADKNGIPTKSIILGGDHLGPYPWKDYPQEYAMKKSIELVKDYVKAGYRKIHIDTTMALADDPPGFPLDIEVEAQRAAKLCKVVEESCKDQTKESAPVYVLGTEVPIPGGVKSDDDALKITSVERVRSGLAVYKKIFEESGLSDAWNRMIGFVVQPGVEFGQFQIHEYKSSLVRPLSQYIESIPNIVYEAHSTDYQLKESLRQMVHDHFAILKVGPALTFAYREAVFSLAKIEKILFQDRKDIQLSNLINVVDQAMVEDSQYWKGYYGGTNQEKAFARKFSYSDRIRYYWTKNQVMRALDKLIDNLGAVTIPMPLISQFLPKQYQHIHEGKIPNSPASIILDHIQEVIERYQSACHC
jgi:D-tagatose-1,6-bisphosphate aldolase subunit GatZ/KbaZ